MAAQQQLSLLEECALATDGTEDSSALLLCLSARIQALEVHSKATESDTAQWLLIFAGALVFMMQTGFAM